MTLPDQTGRRVVVTGANTGLGYITARTLAGAGAEVMLAVRSLEKGDAAAAKIRTTHPSAQVQVAHLDLADLSSVRRFAEARVSAGRLDLLVLNAGVMRVPTRQLTADGFELQMGINYLGHFALTAQLVPVLTRSDPLDELPRGRVVSLSSLAHRMTGTLDRRMGLTGAYASFDAYAQSKLACALFGFELDRRLKTAGASAISVVAHPGYSATELFTRTKDPSPLDRIVGRVSSVVGSTPEQGAQPQIRAAADETLTGGEFIGPRFLLRGKPVRETPKTNAEDTSSAAWLWKQSEELTGESLALDAV